MGKLKGVVRFTGSVGQVTAYKSSAAKKTDSVFVREKVTEVSNPKTAKQAAQRAKMIPAQLFYAGAIGVLDHAFLPKGKASRNKAAFMSRALKLDFVPDVMNGERVIGAAPYEISRGSLPLSSLCLYGGVANQQGTGTSFGLAVTLAQSDPYTVKAFSENVVASNYGLQLGMELTLVVLLANTQDPTERYIEVHSLVLNDTNTEQNWDRALGKSGRYNVANTAGKLTVEGNSMTLLAAGLIISAKDGDSWNYTNSSMILTQMASQSVAGARADVIASYMRSSASSTSDLQLQQADNAPSDVAGYTWSKAVAGESVDVDQAQYNTYALLGLNAFGEAAVLVTTINGIEYIAGVDEGGSQSIAGMYASTTGKLLKANSTQYANLPSIEANTIEDSAIASLLPNITISTDIRP